MKTKTRMLTESALLIAMAIVLELVAKAFIPEMPFGGQVTLVSMLPIVLISYRHGVKWGLLSGVVYAALEMVIGAKTVAAAFQPDYFGSGVLIVNALLMCLLDYVLAFTILGIGGCFRNKIQNPGLSLCLGSIVALSCRYLCHILSGYILFGSYAEWFFTQEGFPAWGANLVASLNPQLLALAYSVVYNGMYMIPEIVFTAVAALLLSKVPGIVKKV
ncbi:MAG TPA: energy-coupled thiamine transporter ThiT [Candidatus Faecousia excrementigallinarum]|uniref:Energy-coupled thiamine transporter ThiT n=1 Tax=Candidatus Faecousia excrementigallinarum TaxID=2840806 RepID=A0A9D1CME6_9FIRM|nr:energy-coupled thiamine transporter ThiT [Candidatus Faecousia excrementigallinarum]